MRGSDNLTAPYRGDGRNVHFRRLVRRGIVLPSSTSTTIPSSSTAIGADSLAGVVCATGLAGGAADLAIVTARIRTAFLDVGFFQCKWGGSYQSW